MKKNKRKLKVHLIGICGAGMSALAVLLKEAGYAVTGSDEEVFEPIPSYLKRNKISFSIGHRRDNVPRDAAFVVVGNHAGLSPEENPETREALRRGLAIRSLPEMLALLSKKKESIVVAGSFGKSTMASLLAFCLSVARRDPSYFVGALPIDLKNSAHAGRGKEFVLEGDEYTSSYYDQRSKFLHLDPRSVVLISAEHDHVNKFPTEASYLAPYKKLLAKIPKKGLLVYSLHGQNNAKIANSAKCIHLSYSVDDMSADYYALNVKYGKITNFDLYRRKKKIITIKTKLLGRHNIENIVGAAAVLLENKKMTQDVFAKAILKFNGVKRRIELKNPKSAIPVYEGFGSSYDKTRAIFESMRLHFPDKRIIAVFEPHAFSWRNKKFIHWYKDIFEGASEVIMLPAISRGKKAPGQITTAEIWTEARKHFPIRTSRNEKETLKLLKKTVKSGDVIALISSGPMFGLAESVPKLF
jgi:UDP-N-acetylmuramate: L-alanyl-gamma-D-glutamyl-meso-diaminopimelate ligase